MSRPIDAARTFADGGAIEQRLLDGERRAEVVRGIGVIERIEGEVGRGELPLRETAN